MVERVVERINIALADDYANDAALKGVQAATLEAHKITVDLLSQKGSGRTYRRGGTVHQASAPGEPPALDTGTLRRSTSFEVRPSANGAEGRVTVSAAYAANLEFGTARIRPRPFLSRIPTEFGAKLRATFLRFAK